jgi:hypothetical protein
MGLGSLHWQWLWKQFREDIRSVVRFFGAKHVSKSEFRRIDESVL